MPITNVLVPGLGESVREAVLVRWHKADGERVAADEPLCELETEKANVDVPSPGAGVLKRVAQPGATVKIGDTIATIDPAGKPTAAPPKAPDLKSSAPSASPAPANPEQSRNVASDRIGSAAPQRSSTVVLEDFSPAVRHLLDEHKLDPSIIPTTGPGGRLTKEDILKYLENKSDDGDERAGDVDLAPAAHVVGQAQAQPGTDGQGTRRAPMSKIRRKIAERLVFSQQSTASLTTFNEVDLSKVSELRKTYKERFEKVHGIGLGFMSFFAKACVLALKEFPAVNAMIDGDDGRLSRLRAPGHRRRVRNAGSLSPCCAMPHQMSFARIESEIKRLATATRDGKLGLEELSGGTFTITNGGDLRFALRHTDPQSTAERHPRHAQDHGPPRRRKRPGRRRGR